MSGLNPRDGPLRTPEPPLDLPAPPGNALLFDDPAPPETPAPGTELSPGAGGYVLDAANTSATPTFSTSWQPLRNAGEFATTYSLGYANVSAALASPHIQDFRLSNDRPLVGASTIVPEASGVEVVVTDPVVLSDSDDANFNVAYEAYVGGVTAGTMTLRTSFTADAPAKTSATFVPTQGGPLAAAHLVWKVLPAAAFLKSDNDPDNNVATDLSTIGQLTQLTWTDDFAQVGDSSDVNTWGSNLTISWMPCTGCSLWAGPVVIDATHGGPGLEVQYPTGVFTIDPSMAGSTSNADSLFYQVQRKSFYANGYYWSWWNDGQNIMFATSSNGSSWSSATPAVAAGAYSFDVHNTGNLVLLTWVGMAQKKVYTRVGIIDFSNAQHRISPQGFSEWSDVAVVDDTSQGAISQSVSGIVTSDGYYWIGAVSQVGGSGNHYARIYRSDGPFIRHYYEDHRINWSGSGGGVTADTVVDLVPGDNGAMTVLLAEGGSADLQWVSMTAGSQQPWSATNASSPGVVTGIFGAVSSKGDLFSAVLAPSGRVAVLYLDGSSALKYCEISGNGCTSTATLDGGNKNRAPSIGRDVIGGLYAVWFQVTVNRQVNFKADDIKLARFSSLGVWSSVSTAYSFIYSSWSAPGIQSTHVPAFVYPALLVTWQTPFTSTRKTISSGTVQLPISSPSIVGAPWAGEGLTPTGTYDGGDPYAISLGTGQLILRSVDLAAPARGLELAVARIYQTPRFYSTGASPAPQGYEESPYGSLGIGWGLDFVWASQTAFYLPGGSKVPYSFGDQGVFESKQGIPFRALRAGSGASTTLQVQFTSGVVANLKMVDTSSGRFVIEWIRDRPNPGSSISFGYNTTAGQGDLNKLTSITDPANRVIKLFYLQGGKVGSLEYGGATVALYHYNALGQLDWAQDALARKEYYGYSTQPLRLLNSIIFKEGGRVTFSYTDPIPVGSDSSIYAVNGRNLYKWGRSSFQFELVQSNSIAWMFVNGLAVYSLKSTSGGYEITSEVEQVVAPMRGYRVTMARDGSGVLKTKDVQWFDWRGYPTRVDHYVGSEIQPRATEWLGFDEWDNPIYTKDAYGFESYASYINSESQGEFQSPGTFNQTQSGLLLVDRFDQWELAGWSTTMSCLSQPCISADRPVFDQPSMRVTTVQSSASSAYAERTFSERYQKVYSSFAVRPRGESTTSWVELLDGNAPKVTIKFASDNQIYITCTNVYVGVCNGGWRIAGSYTGGAWYRIGLDADGAGTSFDVYINNGPVTTGWFPTGNSYFVDRIRFAVDDAPTTKGDFLVNDVIVSKTTGMWTAPAPTLTDLPAGAIVTFIDPAIGPVLVKRSSAGNISPRLPSIAGSILRVRVTEADGTLLADAGLPIGNLDTYRFIPPSHLGPLTSLSSGFGKSSQAVVDDNPAFCTGSQRCLRDVDGKAEETNLQDAASGTSDHISHAWPGEHQQYFFAFSSSDPKWYPGSNDFLVQYVRATPGAAPAEVMLQFHDGTTWDHRAYWGQDKIWYSSWSGQYAKVGPMANNLPTGRWLQLIVRASDLGFTGSNFFDGVAYTLAGGEARWDLTAIGNADTGRLRVQGLQNGQRAELIDSDGSCIVSATAPSGTVSFDLYSPGYSADDPGCRLTKTRVFPLSARIKVFAATGGGVEFLSPLLTIWGGDLLNYKRGDFYANDAVFQGIRGFRGAVATWESGRETLSLDMSSLTPSGSTALDLSGYRNHASLYGSPGAVYGGVDGMALAFDGASQYMTVPSTSSTTATKAFAVSLWIHPGLNPGHIVNVFSKGDPTAGAVPWDIQLFPQDSTQTKTNMVGHVGFTTGTVPVQPVSPNDKPINLNAWNHVVLSYDGHLVLLMINGVPLAWSTQEAKTLVSSTSPLYLAKGFAATNPLDFFNGWVDEVRFYQRGLGEEQMYQLWLKERTLASKQYFQYDSDNLMKATKTEVTTFDGSLYAISLPETTRTYDSFGNPSTMTDPLGQEYRYSYSTAPSYTYLTSVCMKVDSCNPATQNDIRETYTYTDTFWGRVSTRTAPEGAVTTFTYDGIGRPLTVRSPQIGAAQPTESWSYTDALRKVVHTLPSGWTEEMFYDGLGRLEQQFRKLPSTALESTQYFYYDEAGRLIGKYDPRGNAFCSKYDSLGRLTAAFSPGSCTRPANANPTYLATWQYEDNVQRVRYSDETGKITDSYLDFYGRTTRMCQWPGGGSDEQCTDRSTVAITETEYDLAGRPLRSTDGSYAISRYNYNQLGGIARQWYPDGSAHFVEQSYDQSIHRFKQFDLDGSGATTTRAYDPRGLMTSIAYPTSTTGDVSLTYDKNGRLTFEGTSRFSYSYTYNAWDEVLGKTQVVEIGPQSTTVTLSFAYDSYGRLQYVTYPNNPATIVEYVRSTNNPGDNLDRVRAVQGNWGGTVDQVGHDTTDRVSSWRLAQSLTVSVSRDAFYRPTQILVPNLHSWDYAYYKNGDMLSDGSECYFNDGMRELVGAAAKVGGFCPQPQQATTTWAYAKNGDRTQSTDLGRVTNFYYSYGKLWKIDAPANPPLAQYTALWTTDYNGRLRRADETTNSPVTSWVYTYDDADRLTKVEYISATGTETKGEYSYGPDGELMKRVDGGVTQYFLYHGGELYYSWIPNGESRLFVHMEELLVGQKVIPGANPFTEYTVQDAGANIRLILAATNLNVDWEASYSPYGITTVQTNTVPNDLRYDQGNERSAVHLDYLHARWYSPSIGRFQTRDPVEPGPGTSAFVNLYAYAVNSPKTLRDPSGATAINELEGLDGPGGSPIFRGSLGELTEEQGGLPEGLGRQGFLTMGEGRVGGLVNRALARGSVTTFDGSPGFSGPRFARGSSLEFETEGTSYVRFMTETELKVLGETGYLKYGKPDVFATSSEWGLVSQTRACALCGLPEAKTLGVRFVPAVDTFEARGVSKYLSGHPYKAGAEIPGGAPEFFSAQPVPVARIVKVWNLERDPWIGPLN